MQLRCKAIICLLLASNLSGCVSNNEPQASRSIIAQATVYTQESGCKDQSQTRNDTTVPGYCWLPLFSTISMTGKALNEGDEKSSCYADGPTNEQCWPQPGDKVRVVCIATYEGQVIAGVDVPAQRVLSPPKPTENTALTGYNKAEYLKFVNESVVNRLPDCAK